MEETIHARGHEHVTAEHPSTFEITTDDYLTPAGDCILAIDADRAPADFDPEFVDACQDTDATITCTIATDDHVETVEGSGDPELELTNERSAVGRTSEYVDDRTILVNGAFAADGFSRDLVEALANEQPVTVTLAVE